MNWYKTAKHASAVEMKWMEYQNSPKKFKDCVSFIQFVIQNMDDVSSDPSTRRAINNATDTYNKVKSGEIKDKNVVAQVVSDIAEKISVALSLSRLSDESFYTKTELPNMSLLRGKR